MENRNYDDTEEVNIANQPPLEKSKKTKKKQIKRNTLGAEIFSWVKTIVLALVLAYLITQYLIVNAVVPSGSMETTVMTNDRLIANRLSYVFSDPERYDIVVFKFPDDESTLYIKRIIGMPGETIVIKDGQVYVDGQAEPLKNDFVNGEMLTDETLGEYPMEFTIPKKGDNIADFEHVKNSEIYDADNDGKFDEDCYFMLGDNRNKSADSRLWNNKYLSKNKIEGKALFRYFPFTALGTIQ